MATQQCEVEVRQFVFKSQSPMWVMKSLPEGWAALSPECPTPSVHTQVWGRLHSLVRAWQAQITPGSWLAKPLLHSQSLSVITGWMDECSQSAPAMEEPHGCYRPCVEGIFCLPLL